MMVKRYYAANVNERSDAFVLASDYDKLAAEHKRIAIAQCQAEAAHLRRIAQLEAQCEGMAKSCIANAGWILKLEAALGENEEIVRRIDRRMGVGWTKGLADALSPADREGEPHG